MKILITGASGMLGQDMAAQVKNQGWERITLSHSDLDICDLNKVKSVISQAKPEVIINCAAYTNVDGAETNRYEALMINGLGVRNLAVACEYLGSSLVHISTDYVFDGKKEGAYTIYDQTKPINTYGESKLLGEWYILHLLRRFYLVRTTWLFGIHGHNFVETILKASEQQKELRVVDDQVGSPTFTEDLTMAIIDLISAGCYGIYHATSQGTVSWYGFAKAIMEQSNRDIPVVPICSDQFPRPARRPANSVLDPFPLAETTGRLLPPWEDALQRYLSRRKEIGL